MKHKSPILYDAGAAVLQAPTPQAIRALAARLKRANNPGMQLLNMVGNTADGLFGKLPAPIKTQLETVTLSALELAFSGAARSRKNGFEGGGWLSKAISSGLGAVGGIGGLPTALAELPVTTTILLHAIQAVAVEHGFDPERSDIRKACINVFAAAGPLDDDDGADLGFLAARTSLTGATLNGIIARVAPRLSIVLGQKLAAQTVPVLGAVAGAATNYAYTAYYQDMAHVTFGMLRLSEDSGESYETLKDMLRAEIASS
ncbi:EcsC family protein [Pacificibacter marinus]|uniref:EcsC protein family protein n=1 Tax=Pacificibacter marinus TaxID=658057 RepID=A0A1Y5RHI2_9RHOB|nr:EcsC family protein [Pacificibacter marinus]SEK18919.1 EcsC protein family protein [Pacificibacter marinus]SLN17524.1 EcsC protein family protein [Pacificibacter marinus]